ncbi:hypothetical protein B0T22DRAFT_182719 [Podospora appendiculata]|uniref:G domain-containing protein n=1 Tax=Podospora appendiculata TaxID=314037 RepID=A0AAE0XCB1_9PEZI|nr:hypothetical protein B0T22DRAFT_182719 [Podospora appendiculata]
MTSALPEDYENISPDDVFIPVIGLTGSGKSRFISLCIGEEYDENDDSDAPLPGATGFKVHSFEHCGRTVHLIDTPGFDQPGREDHEVLQECVYWLSKSFEAGIKVTGMVYTYPIDLMRLPGSARRALQMFKAMCGIQNAPSTVMATTMWDKVERDVGEERVDTLAEEQDFWGDFYDAGSHILPVLSDQRSALKIISLILGSSSGLTLQIQKQMLVEKMMLHQTDAGKVLYGNIMTEKHALEDEIDEIKRSMQEQLGQAARQDQVLRLEEMARAKNDKLETRVAAVQEIQKTKDDLTVMWDIRVRDDMRRMRLELLRNQEHLQDLEDSLAGRATNGAYQERKEREELERELKRMRKKVEMLQKENRFGATAGVLLTGGKVVGGGLGVAAAIIPLVACCIM